MVEFPTIQYNLKIGPHVRNIDRTLRELPFLKNDIGVNCQLYTSLLVRALGYRVPDYYRSSEWYSDPENVLEKVILPKEQIQSGDVLGFLRPNDTDMKHLHLGVAKVNAAGVVEVLHASRLAQKVILTPLHKMNLDRRNMQQLYMIRRPMVKKPRNFHALYALGWFASDN